MDFEFGNKHFPIWVMSDIEPSYLDTDLEGPFDYRHPIRHIVCTSVFHVIQHHVYLKNKKRVDDQSLYYRSTTPQEKEKPKINEALWPNEILKDVERIKTDIMAYKPKIIFSFGAYTYELVRRATEKGTARSYGSWTPAELGGEFKACIKEFDPEQTNVLPLMDRSIIGWKFIVSHEQYVGRKNSDYFNYVGKEIAAVLSKFDNKLDVWID